MVAKTALAFAGALLLMSPASGLAADGTFHGTLTCAKLSWTKGPQRVPITIRVAGTKASYSRPIYNADNSRVIGTETGRGTVAANGSIRLIGEWRGKAGHYRAYYRGQLTGADARLSGTQAWVFKGRRFRRACTFTAHR